MGKRVKGQEAKEKEYFGSKFEIKEVDEDSKTGFISGYASVFGTVDQGFDIVHRGAFTKTIKDKKGVFPHLLDHNPYKPAGFSSKTEEHERGLYYEAELKLHDPDVKQRYELAKLALKYSTSYGNSFGYRAIKYDFEDIESDDGVPITVRHLREVKLYEKSLVTFPMHTDAGVLDVKSFQIFQLFDRIQKGQYSFKQIQKALESIEERTSTERAANKGSDPELLIQSLNKLGSVFN